jgi:exosortase C (VPDSG-CTERM-specific)
MKVVFGLLAVGFAKPLFDLVNFAFRSTIYSHILIIPFLTGYLLRTQKAPWQYNSRPNLKLGAVPMSVAAGLLACFLAARGAGRPLSREDQLALLILPLVCLIFALACAFLAGPSLRRACAPLGFLFFLAPFPSAVLHGMETFLQYGSAHTAEWMLSLSGMPVLRVETFFRLPGFEMEVAPECSGIRSTWMLFITSLVAGYVFLRSPVRRAVLAAAVVPLALLRNGFRIFTLGQLCVNVDPSWIDSPLHHQGGPIFFVLSLIPFFLLLLWLRRLDRKSSSVKPE